jgi:glycosyltransferase involved in cell wall biosynthesis
VLGHVQDVDRLFHNTDILVFPSYLNGPSRSVFEAGIYGIPSVVSMRDRVEDVVEHGVTGLIVPEKDPPALAKALETLADDNDLRVRLGRNAQRKYISQADPRVSAHEVLEVYRSLVMHR